ncbi:hypothetical protein CAV_0630 [Campylobacter avium LMG 24591]|uniref:Flagellar protein FliL n=1 Tax=Campylobacter avium LMG 24591 TaxID=522484 RepID=A0A222MXL5_9BACT|nr:hypothetical protein [Campylobacter avium]ASQ30296.1 hypothetical protein CAV_0630 [Campylobacter avium LMG 24591]OYD79394.1 hypothetical protein CAV8706_0631 [Campylobacter avium]
MRILIFLFLSLFFIQAQSFKIEDLRTELYSKEGKNILKKIELSLEFEGENLEQNKLKDATNTVISSFFYEDIFTELGKLRFKQSLSRYIKQKYKIDIKEVYIIKLKGVQKFDIEELKSFLKDYEFKDDKDKKEDKKKDDNLKIDENLSIPKIDEIEDVGKILADENENLSVDEIDPSILEIPSLPENIELQLKDKNLSLKDLNASR